MQIRLTLNWTRFPPLIWQILQFRGMGKVSLIQIMQKLTGSVPRPTSLSGVLCGRYAVGLCLKRQDRLSFAQAGENASGCPPARRARLGCDCSSLSPLTLKPLRSPTPRPFTAIATALLSGYAAHAAARSMVTATVAAGLGSSVASLPQCRRDAFSASIKGGVPPPVRCASRKLLVMQSALHYVYAVVFW